MAVLGRGGDFTRPAVAMVTSPPFRQSSLIRRENLEFEVLSLLETEPGLSQRELACRLGASLGRINSCIRAMIENGSMKRVQQSSGVTGLPRVCAVTELGLARRSALAGDYMQRKRAELDRLAGQIAALQPGDKP